MEPPPVKPLAVKPKAIVRTGLTNGIGERRCFLNAVLQALWSLTRFLERQSPNFNCSQSWQVDGAVAQHLNLSFVTLDLEH